MKKVLLGCLIAAFALPTFANSFRTDITEAVRAVQVDQQRVENDEKRYYILTSAATYEALQGNELFRNIKMDKSPVPMRPVPKAI